MIRKSWIFWYIIKFKNAYLVLLWGKLIENLLTRKKLKTLQILWKLDYLRVFWNYLDINYVFQSICNMWALCGFNTMPCVISRWSPDLVFVIFVTTKSDPGQCPFTLDDAFFLVVYGGKWFLNCVWVRLLPMGPRDHMQEGSYLMCSFCCLWGERKTLRVWVRLLSMGPRVCIPKRTISCQLWMGGSFDRSM